MNFFDAQSKDDEILNLQRINRNLKRDELTRMLADDGDADEEEEC